jgi:adenosylcobinamide-phosphate synthase
VVAVLHPADILRPDPYLLAAAVALDLLLGDPVYRAHPVRLIGYSLSGFERLLRKFGLDGYGGGVLLFLLLAGLWCGGLSALAVGLARRTTFAGYNNLLPLALHLFLLYSLIALRDLLRHTWAVESAARRGDLEAARRAVSQLVGRDTNRMDLAACRRAAIESLSENLTDGFISAVFWYLLGGLPGIVLFKVVSTMDSMVGYKTPRYLRFGWCGARLDDAMNWLPARLTWLLITCVALPVAGCSAKKAFQVGWRQHALVPGPNSGWSEAAIAGAIQRRLVGPIWKDELLVNEVWLGEISDPPAGGSQDMIRASVLVVASGLAAVAIAVASLLASR